MVWVQTVGGLDFFIGLTLIWWKMIAVAINPVWFGFARETVCFGLSQYHRLTALLT